MMTRHAWAWTLGLTLVAVGETASAQSVNDLVGKDGVVTLVNLHPDEARSKLYSANYLQPGLIPVCSEVKLVSYNPKALTVTVPSRNKTYTYEFHRAATEGFDAHLLKVFGTRCPKKTIEGLSKVDQEGIKAGRAVLGMSREGVIYAIGYPPASQTPVLDGPTWKYWKNRFDIQLIHFDDKGKVMQVKD
jgi:hypothetical protein